jgi:hypothetical protein
MRAVDVVLNGAGRRELFTLHVQFPVKNCIWEKSGFGVIGIGVDSIVGFCANAAPHIARRTPVTKAA